MLIISLYVSEAIHSGHRFRYRFANPTNSVSILNPKYGSMRWRAASEVGLPEQAALLRIPPFQ